MLEESPSVARKDAPIEAALGEVIRIDRDYSVRVPTFPVSIPPALASRLPAEQFTRTIEMINTILFEASEAAEEDAAWRGLLSCVLLHLGPRFWLPPERLLYQRLSGFVNSENDRTYGPAGLELRNPLLNGLLFIDIVILRSKPAVAAASAAPAAPQE